MRWSTRGDMMVCPIFLRILVAAILAVLSNQSVTAAASDMYQQTAYQLVDPAGDEALRSMAYDQPGELISSLFKSNPFADPGKGREAFAEELGYTSGDALIESAGQEHDEKNQDGAGVTLEGRENPIKIEEFRNMLMEVIAEERASGIAPGLGTPHRWSPQILRSHSSLDLALNRSKLLIALAVGVTSQFMVSGTEEQLKAWIMSQPDNSITLEQMFREAYRENQGDTYLTLLSIENVLAKYWRVPEREDLPFTRKLQSFTITYGAPKDRFGTWYHFFGIMLYGYVYGRKAAENVAGWEVFMGRLYGRRGEYQKEWINRVGADLGHDLREDVQEWKYMAPVDPWRLEADYYLNRQGDFRDRLPIVRDPNLSIGISDGLILRSSTTRSDCEIETMVDKGSGYNVLKIKRLEHRTLKTNSRTYLRMKLTGLAGVRGFVSHCADGSPDSAFEVRFRR